MSNVLETKQAVEFILRFAEATESALEDGKFTFLDFPKFVPVLGLLNEALSGAKQIPGELSALTEEGQAELHNLIGTLKLEDADYDKIGEEALKIVVSVVALVGMIKEAKKKK